MWLIALCLWKNLWKKVWKTSVKPLRSCDLGVQAISTSSICQGAVYKSTQTHENYQQTHKYLT